MPTPGVFVNELNEFPNSVVGVPTAVPAFIGYTPQALFEGKSYLNVPIKISSFIEFQEIFCFPEPKESGQQVKQYSPHYYLVEQKGEPAKGAFIILNNKYYAIVPDPNTIYYLYNSVKIFYENGGGDAYIVSVGPYGDASKTPTNPGDTIVNPNVQLNDLLAGLQLLSKEDEPTLYICPEATLLSIENNGTLMQEMLLQCTQMQTAMSVFDIIGGNAPEPILYENDITTFRENTGTVGLNYGTAYYPFIGTTMMQPDDIDYTNLFGGDLQQLTAIINPAESPDPTTTAIIANIKDSSSTLTVEQNDNALINANPTYDVIIKNVLAIANLLPPSAAMAGIMARVDQEEGVWVAPANTSIVGVASLPMHLSETDQGGLNVDAVTGKSINAIRYFSGMGILVWGARTLDGNSADWKYIPVRRTVIFLEQSCKLAIRNYIFQPNDKNTWEAIKATISSFLTSIWKEGGLQGAAPTDAFAVDCGLGVTMTADDIINGILNVSIKVAVTHPAEFIVITLQQDMSVTS